MSLAATRAAAFINRPGVQPPECKAGTMKNLLKIEDGERGRHSPWPLGKGHHPPAAVLSSYEGE